VNHVAGVARKGDTRRDQALGREPAQRIAARRSDDCHAAQRAVRSNFDLPAELFIPKL
jgi:hypothetical protein